VDENNPYKSSTQEFLHRDDKNRLSAIIRFGVPFILVSFILVYIPMTIVPLTCPKMLYQVL
jgi:hypothetical protein